MNSKERVTAALNLEEPDRVPVFIIPWPSFIEKAAKEILSSSLKLTELNLEAHMGTGMAPAEKDKLVAYYRIISELDFSDILCSGLSPKVKVI